MVKVCVGNDVKVMRAFSEQRVWDSERVVHFGCIKNVVVIAMICSKKHPTVGQYSVCVDSCVLWAE